MTVPFVSRVRQALQGWTLPVLGLLGLGLALSLVYQAPQPLPREPLVCPPVQPYPSGIAGLGLVEPRSEWVHLGAQTPGLVQRVHVQAGDWVKASDPLVELDARELTAQVCTLEASLQVACVQAQRAQYRLELVQGADQAGLVSAQEVALRRYDALEAQARAQHLRAQLHEALVRRDTLTLRAPLEAQVLRVSIHAGEWMPSAGSASSAGGGTGVSQQTAILLGDTSCLHVRVQVDEAHASSICPQAQAQAYTRDEPTRPLPLTWVRTEPYVLPKQNLAQSGQRVDTRVLEVIYALSPQASQQLYPGQQVDVYIQAADPQEPDLQGVG